MSNPLATELVNHLYLLDRLRAQFPDEEDSEFADSLEGLTNLHEMLAATIRQNDDDEAMVAGLTGRIEELGARQERLKHRIESRRHIVAETMERAGIAKVTAFDCTISLSHRAPGVVIIDESQIPEDFMRTPEPPAPKPDKKLILAALNDGFAVAGATLGNGSTSISVRKR